MYIVRATSLIAPSIPDLGTYLCNYRPFEHFHLYLIMASLSRTTDSALCAVLLYVPSEYGVQSTIAY